MMASGIPRRCLMGVTGLFHSDGGMAAANRLSLRALVEGDCIVDVLSLNESDLEVDTRYVDSARVDYQTFRGHKPRFVAELWKRVLKGRHDLILFDHVNLASALSPLVVLGCARYIVWMFGIEVFPPRPDLEGTLGLRLAGKRLVSSGYTRDRVAARFPDLPVTVCDLALDPVRHATAGTARPSDLHQPIAMQAVDGIESVLGTQVILHVGRMAAAEQYKGQDTLIQALPMVCEQNPVAQLVLVGQGDDMSRLIGLAHRLHASIQSRVFFPGYVSDDLLARIYQTCYVFAMPSTGEGFGLVFLEAMSRGKPCLGGRVDATPYVVRDGTTGLLVEDPSSAEQVAAALNWFLAHPEDAQEMGRKGAELIQSYYLFPHFQQRFWQAVLQV